MVACPLVKSGADISPLQPVSAKSYPACVCHGRPVALRTGPRHVVWGLEMCVMIYDLRLVHKDTEPRDSWDQAVIDVVYTVAELCLLGSVRGCAESSGHAGRNSGSPIGCDGISTVHSSVWIERGLS